MAFHSLYDRPGLAPHMNVLFRGSSDFSASYSNRDHTSWNVWNHHPGSFMVNTGILFSNIKSPSHECYMTFWSLTRYNDFRTDQIFHHLHDLVEARCRTLISPKYEWFPWSIYNGCGMPTWNAYPQDTWFRPFCCGLHVLWLLRPVFPNIQQCYDRDAELDLHRIMRGSMGHLRRVGHASIERVPFLTPSSVPFFWGGGHAYAPISRTCHWSGGGRVVKLLACGAIGPGSISGLATWISEIGYLLLPSRDMAEIPIKRRKSSIQPTNQPERVVSFLNFSLWLFLGT